MGEFDRQVVVITGGGAGIGKATALLFGREKASVVVIDCDEKAARRTVKEIQDAGSDALALKADVGNSRQVKSAFAAAVRKFGKIDILFANAAVQVIKPIDSTSDGDWERVISANLRGTFLCCREAVRVMRRQRSGCIIIATSGHAFQSYAGYAAYASSKGGQLAMMRAMAIDCASSGIRVNCVVPGATETELLRAHFRNNPKDKARLLSRIPMARLAAPEDIARAVRLLASCDASYITGSYLVVDGGLLAQG
ncbi:MAG TPA: SDR family oxidoreductase [Terriglobales bacterium]|nr:SDR family oxidoreductase [Terriglobales bacterium]